MDRNFLFTIDGEEIIVLAKNKIQANEKLKNYFVVDNHIIAYCGEISEEDAEMMGIDTYD